jgi:CPA1 family monovalent cation:H+ antiporter
LRKEEANISWRALVALGWMGMRGAVSMAAALSLPFVTSSGAAFPERGRLLALTYGVVLWTLLVQGLSLPALIRWAGLRDDGLARREEMEARLAASEAAVARIDTLLAEGAESSEFLRAIRRRHEATLRSLRQHLQRKADGHAEAHDARLLITESQQRLAEQVIDAERKALLQLREDGAIHDEVLHRLERELDLEEERLHLGTHLGGEGTHLG